VTVLFNSKEWKLKETKRILVEKQNIKRHLCPDSVLVNLQEAGDAEEYIVACRPVARHRRQDRRLYSGRR
jgi:hypothetical protein